MARVEFQVVVAFDNDEDVWDNLDFWSEHPGSHWVDYDSQEVIFPFHVEDIVGKD